MRVFIYEHTTGGGLAGEEIPASLAREGWAMRAAVAGDFASAGRAGEVSGKVAGEIAGEVAGEVSATLDARLESRKAILEAAGVRVFVVSKDSIEPLFTRLARECDFTLVVAPETAGVLGEMSRRVLEAGGNLLGSAPEAVDLAGDKLRLARHLAESDIPAIPLVEVEIDGPPPQDGAYPAVLKPRDGAGSLWTYRIESRAQAPEVFRAAKNEGAPPRMVLGALAEGLAASASFLIGSRGAVPLLAGEQILSSDGRFRYEGGRLPLPTDLGERAVRLARRAVEAVPGLSGFVGVDLVLASIEDGDRVVEINPRLTTSYVGLRRLARGNLAETWLEVVRGNEAKPLEWRKERARFTAESASP